MKKCSTCKIEKNESEFAKNASSKDGYAHRCKACVKIHYENNKEEILKKKKEYNEENKEQLSEYKKQWYENNKEDILKDRKIYYLDNKNEKLEYSSNYYKNNKVSVNKYNKERRKNDIIFRLRRNVSSTIADALKSNNSSKRGKSILDFLGYSILDLKNHLEKHFESWMSWENYGLYNSESCEDNDTDTWTWQIDHIIPQSKLLYASMQDENFKKCWALENLRPLWSKQNLLDGNRRILLVG